MMQRNDLEATGFKIIGSASVPQKGFELPGSRKGKQKQPKQVNSGSSICVVTVCCKINCVFNSNIIQSRNIFSFSFIFKFQL